jgi:hypothetical protein
MIEVSFSHLYFGGTMGRSEDGFITEYKGCICCFMNVMAESFGMMELMIGIILFENFGPVWEILLSRGPSKTIKRHSFL